MHLIGAGLWSALAPGLAGTRAAIAEGRRALRRQRTFMGTDFKPQVTAFDGDLSNERASDRMFRIATLALDDLAGADATAPDGPLAVAVAVALPEPASAEGLEARALSALGQRISTHAGECPAAQKPPEPLRIPGGDRVAYIGLTAILDRGGKAARRDRMVRAEPAAQGGPWRGMRLVEGIAARHLLHQHQFCTRGAGKQVGIVGTQGGCIEMQHRLVVAMQVEHIVRVMRERHQRQPEIRSAISVARGRSARTVPKAARTRARFASADEVSCPATASPARAARSG